MCDKIKLFIAACFCCFINMQIKNLHPCLKSFQTRPCFQLVFHWVSKPIHLTRMRCSGWVRAAWIINEFENKISHCPVIIQIYAPIIGLPQDGGRGWGGGVGQSRGVRLRKAHVSWDFDIHNVPWGGKFDLTAILKSWEDLGMSDEWCAILENTQNSFEWVSRVQGWLNERERREYRVVF